MPGSPLFYWDSCLFLAWLKDEETRAGGNGRRSGHYPKNDAPRRQSYDFRSDHIEVLSSRIPLEWTPYFIDLIKRLNRQSVDIRVAAIAHDLRNYYALAGRSLKSPDAIHLATAILYRADEFHTFDDQLIALSGNVGGEQI